MQTRKVSGTQIPADVAGTMGAGQAGKTDSATTTSSVTQSGAAAKTNGTTGGTTGGINVAVSPKARELADARKKAFDIAKATPEIREERVAALKAQIQSGQYQVDPGKIADGIAREALLEYLADSEGKSRI